MSAAIQPGRTRIGVVGAGTMGSGIALAALYADFRVILQDVSPQALERAGGYVRKYLERKGQGEKMKRLTLTEGLDGLAGVDVVIEAALEDLDAKREIFSNLDGICPPPAILATNTSTLSVTAIAAATSSPERVAGMHFFNPAAVMPLVEVVRAAETAPQVVERITQLAEALRKTPVVTGDTPGFIVNRVARPFYGEALRLLGEGVAGHEEIDLVVQGGGFPMGPFRLMDLIGIDVNTAAMQSMYEQTYGEPRYRPHWLQVQKVEQGALGVKTGRGFYTYGEGGEEAEAAETLENGGGGGTVVVAEGTWAPGMAELCGERGYSLRQADDLEGTVGIAVAPAGTEEGLREQVEALDERLPPDVPLLVQAADAAVAEIATWMAHPGRLVGFDGLFIAESSAASLVPGPRTDEGMRQVASDFVRSLGRTPVWVKDSPGLILPRLVCQLVNEAAFAVLEGVAGADTVDQAMRLGVNYPRGPLEWGKRLGYRRVLAVLDHLHREYREARYRACTLLRRWARLEQLDDQSSIFKAFNDNRVK